MNSERFVALLCLVAACAACKDDKQDPPPPAAISIVAGDLQSGVVGAALSVAPTVRVDDAQGQPVANATVTFAVLSGGGNLSATTVSTGTDGRASTSWTLGTAPGANSLRATVAGLPVVEFSATALVGPAAQLIKWAGDGQVAAPGTAVSVNPAVKVTDALGNPVEGAAVGFAVTAGGGYAFVTSAVTDSSGLASSGPWTLGEVRGANTLTASVSGAAPVAFDASVTADVLLDLGHSSEITLLRFQGSRVLSQEANGRWVLWDYDTCAMLASGRSLCETDENRCAYAVDMAGPTIVIAVAAGFELRASSDGHLLATIPTYRTPEWFRLATDGSYVAAVLGSEHLRIWSSAGQLLVDRPANYFTARAFAAPGELRVAKGPAGADVVETISVPGGASSVSPTFLGQFYAWFGDGERFLTNVSTTVWTYSKAGAQEAVWSLPSVSGMTGHGSWVWTVTYPDQLAFYRLDGGGAPAATYTVDSYSVRSSADGTPIESHDGGVSIFDLSGSSPSRTDHAVPAGSAGLVAATGSDRFVIGHATGLLLDGTSLASTPRACGLGAAKSIAGSASRGAVATASGSIYPFDSAGVFGAAIPFLSSKLELSSDGTLLAAKLGRNDLLPPVPDIELYSLPSGSSVASWPSADFSLSGSGLYVGLVTSAGATCDRDVVPVGGGAATWSETGASCDPVRLSPDGSLVATSDGGLTTSAVTRVFKDGVLQTTLPGFAVDWIDDARLLVNTYEHVVMPYDTYAGCKIYDPSGAQVAAPALPELEWLQTISADTVYSPLSFGVYSLTTGERTWTSVARPDGVQVNIGSSVRYPVVGAVVGSRVVFASGSRILSEPY